MFKIGGCHDQKHNKIRWNTFFCDKILFLPLRSFCRRLKFAAHFLTDDQKPAATLSLIHHF